MALLHFNGPEPAVSGGGGQDYKLDESYTPAQISVRAGTTFHIVSSATMQPPHSILTVRPHR
jgi:hypothetical protein